MPRRSVPLSLTGVVLLMARSEAERIGIPVRPFLYTVDQIATLLNLSEQKVHVNVLYHEGRDIGMSRKDQMTARNIARREDKPDWRVTERELVRWMKVKGFEFYERGWARK